MFKLPSMPNPKANVAELADFLEIFAWVKKSTSAQEAVRYLGIVDDNISHDNDGYEGCEDQEDEHLDQLDHVFIELENRAASCGEVYPFNIDSQAGSTLSLKDEVWNNSQSIAYLYFLAATRLNMKVDRVLNGIDGTLAMESISAHALKQYLGIENGRVFIFGTSSIGNFKDRINKFMREIGEKGRFKNIDGDNARLHAQDDKLDVVGWIPFKDNYPCQLIVFTQAKTGTNWRDKIQELNPETFQRRWLDQPFLVLPLRAFCVAEAVDRSAWNSICIGTGILFDRCRLVEFCSEAPKHKMPKDISRWTMAAQTKISSYLEV